MNAVVKDSLVESEARAKGLDKLYREASEENEALYVRHNEESERLMKAQLGQPGEKGKNGDALTNKGIATRADNGNTRRSGMRYVEMHSD